MVNSGIKGLGNVEITGPDTYYGAVVSKLDGMQAFTAQTRFVFGSDGGTPGTVRAVIQGSADQGDTFIDLACARFDASNETVVVNLVNGPAGLRAPAELADDSALADIPNCDRLRLKVVSTQHYTGTMVSCFVAVR